MGRPADGYFTKRTAEAWLRDMLDQAHKGTLPGMVRTGATFADAAAQWLRYVEQERGRKASTLADYRSVVRAHFLPAFGGQPLERITEDMIERWLSTQLREGELSVVRCPWSMRSRRRWLGWAGASAGAGRTISCSWGRRVGTSTGRRCVAATRRRDAAGLRPLRFHDLRHTFGSVAIRTADPRELQEWMGHSDFSTTQIYMHYRPRADAARRLSTAFTGEDATAGRPTLASPSE